MSIGIELDQVLANVIQRIAALENGAPLGSVAPPASFSGFKNLRIAGSNATKKYVVSFSDAILHDSAGNSIRTGPRSFTIDTAVSGLNGVDIGSIQGGNKWYKLHIVSDGTDVGGVLSLNNTPTLPTGFVYSAFAGTGQCLSINPVVIITQFQIDNRVTQQARGILKIPGVAAVAANTLQLLDIAEYVPPETKTISGQMLAPTGRDMQMAICPMGPDFYDVGRLCSNGVGMPAYDGFGATDNFSDFALFYPQKLYWKSSDTVARNGLYLTGYTI